MTAVIVTTPDQLQSCDHGPSPAASAAQASARKAGGAPCARPRDLSPEISRRVAVGWIDLLALIHGRMKCEC